MAIKTRSKNAEFIYDEFGLIQFYGESIIYNPYDYTTESLLFIQSWMQDILKSKDPLGDCDKDGVMNVEDRYPFIDQFVQ